MKKIIILLLSAIAAFIFAFLILSQIQLPDGKTPHMLLESVVLQASRSPGVNAESAEYGFQKGVAIDTKYLLEPENISISLYCSSELAGLCEQADESTLQIVHIEESFHARINACCLESPNTQGIRCTAVIGAERAICPQIT